ncbi:MAG TPA: sugar ABC transporter permease [Geminicoccaceae bacterium]|nr:sugar ABC transporter permease [Geminicoccus sp.]HMU51710.1 sugar ABC transporter permease [Geminicoccaceae bacterium]
MAIGAAVGRRLTPYLFLAPFFAVFALFWLVPVLASFGYSLTEWRGIMPPRFIGLGNYAELWRSPRFHTALANTLVLALSYVVLANIAALSLALLLDAGWMRLKQLFRTAFFLPMTISIVVSAVIFQLVYAGDIGLVAKALDLVGIEGPVWLQQPGWATAAIIIMRVWRTMGYYAIIYLAGLQTVPSDLREAARIDGATPVQIIRHVVLPTIRPVILFCVVISTISGLEMFDEVMILTQGGPADTTLTVAVYLYQQGFQFLQLGHAAAASYVLTCLIVLISILQKLTIGRDPR